MNKNKFKLISIFFYTALMVYFLVRFYLFGYSIDTLAWTKEIVFFDRVILVGLAISIMGTIIMLTNRIPKPIKITVMALGVLVFIASIVTTPDWDAIEKNQINKYTKTKVEENLYEDVKIIENAFGFLLRLQ